MALGLPEEVLCYMTFPFKYSDKARFIDTLVSRGFSECEHLMIMKPDEVKQIMKHDEVKQIMKPFG